MLLVSCARNEVQADYIFMNNVDDVSSITVALKPVLFLVQPMGLSLNLNGKCLACNVCHSASSVKVMVRILKAETLQGNLCCESNVKEFITTDCSQYT